MEKETFTREEILEDALEYEVSNMRAELENFLNFWKSEGHDLSDAPRVIALRELLK